MSYIYYLHLLSVQSFIYAAPISKLMSFMHHSSFHFFLFLFGFLLKCIILPTLWILLFHKIIIIINKNYEFHCQLEIYFFCFSCPYIVCLFFKIKCLLLLTLECYWPCILGCLGLIGVRCTSSGLWYVILIS